MLYKKLNQSPQQPYEFKRRMSIKIENLINNMSRVKQLYFNYISFKKLLQDPSFKLNKLISEKPTPNSTRKNASIEEKAFNYRPALNEKEREIKILENMQPKRFNKDYVEKFVTLLHESRSLKPSYSSARKKIKRNIKTENKRSNINGNGIYITLPNVEDKNNDNYSDEDAIPFPNYLIEEDKNENNLNFNHKSYDLLTDTVKDILFRNKEESELESYRQKEKLLYEQLRTKKAFNKNRFNSANRNISYENNNNFNNKRRKNYLSPKFIKNFDNNLAKSVENNNFQKLTENQVKNLYYISELRLFDNIDELGRKNKILKEINNYQKRKYMDTIDVFKYNKKKWDEKRKEMNKNINNIMFNKFNRDNKKYLKIMKKGVDKTHDDSKLIEKDMIKYIDDINSFIDLNSEYLLEVGQSNKESLLHTKKTSFNRRPNIGKINPANILPKDK